eukprot:TRINITY_DN4530_c0_g1_i1.p1 TRINITY_DN4530_c0_g1~~TRINITY_DN4530_c0_g1_i1.p1  ORF type:complete len:833 (-),score=149.94 TRINITY_DN4530_c0_g1_i1:19-2517(-)
MRLAIAALLVFSFITSSASTTIVITSTGDSGIGTLREAIETANSLDPTQLPASLSFAWSGALAISFGSDLPVIEVPVIIDCPSSSKALITGGAAFGLVLAGGNSTVSCVRFEGFITTGLHLRGLGNNLVKNCDFTGNKEGLRISSDRNIIGEISTPNVFNNNNVGVAVSGSNANVITNCEFTGNTDRGVVITNSTGITLDSNFIGTDLSGLISAGNLNGGILLGSESSDCILKNNLISSNGGPGIEISAGRNHVISSNKIGLTSGLSPLPNSGPGIWIHSLAAINLTIGTSSAGRNVIANNLGGGVLLENTQKHTIRANFIGVTGPTLAANRGDALQLKNCSDVRVAENTIAGGAAVHLQQSKHNIIETNFVGTSSDGSTAFAGTSHVVLLELQSSNNTLSGNVIGGGGRFDGIRVSASNDNKIMNNFIGTNAASADLANANGVSVISSSTTAIQTNTIAYNKASGVTVIGTGTGNKISQNKIFLNGVTGINALSNYTQPIITDAVNYAASNELIIVGFVYGNATFYSIECYCNSLPLPEGVPAQGELYIGTFTIVTSQDAVTQELVGEFSVQGSANPTSCIYVTCKSADYFSQESSRFSEPRNVTNKNDSPPPTTGLITTMPLTTSPLTTKPLTTKPLTTKPLTTKPLTTSPLTTKPLTTSPITSGAVTSGSTTRAWTSGELTTSPLTTKPLTSDRITSGPITSGDITTESITTAAFVTDSVSTSGLENETLSGESTSSTTQESSEESSSKRGGLDRNAVVTIAVSVPLVCIFLTLCLSLWIIKKRKSLKQSSVPRSTRRRGYTSEDDFEFENIEPVSGKPPTFAKDILLN